MSFILVDQDSQTKKYLLEENILQQHHEIGINATSNVNHARRIKIIEIITTETLNSESRNKCYE